MPRTNRTKERIEIYLSQDSADDVKTAEIWRILSQSGRGRAQAFFRRALIRGIKTMKTPDIPDDIVDIINSEVVLEKKRRGPKKKWSPSREEREEINLGLQTEDIKQEPEIPREILDEYSRLIEEEEPTPETLGFMDEPIPEEMPKKKKSRIGSLM